MNVFHRTPRALLALACIAVEVRVSAQETDAGEHESSSCEGGVEGIVRDAVTGETLIEAPVRVVGAEAHALTDIEGRFRLPLRPGHYALRTHYDLYQPAQVEGVVVTRGPCTVVELALTSEATVGDEVVIDVRADLASTATQLRERREAVTAQDGLSGEELRRSADGDAGEAARRIVGATVVGGQYLVVRGLSGRYGSALLNGAFLPSADPDQPGVQLDLFPSGVLDGLVLHKTYSAELPGDGTGGTLMLTTRALPERFTLGVSASLGIQSRTTLASAPTGPAGALDWLGVDDGRRQLPASVPADRTLQSLDETARIEAAQGFRPRFGLRETAAAPAGRLSLLVGDTLPLGGARRLGFVVSLSYANTTQILRDELIRPGASVTGVDPEGRPVLGVQEAQRRVSFTNSVTLGGLGVARLELSASDALQLTLLATQNSDSYTGLARGYDFESDQNIEATRIRWLERGVLFGQLAGRHAGLPFGAELGWTLAGSLGGRREPDIRDMIYGANVGSDARTFRPATAGSGERFFLGLDQREVGGSLDLRVPLAGLTLRAGGALRVQERGFGFRRVRYEGTGGSADALPATQLFDPSRNGVDYVLVERTDRTDGYAASQTLGAAYVTLEWPVLSWLRIVGGLRLEAFRQTVASGSVIFPAQGANPRDTHRTDLDPLGSAGVIFRASDEVNLRLAYGATVARPQIRELASFVFPDFVRQRTITGRPGLRRTRIHNFDARLEWFPGATEVLAVSAFAKQFEEPIEITAEANNQFSYRNFESALVAGVELEARVGLGRLAEFLRPFDVAANASLVHSQVVLGAAQGTTVTHASRPLSGQSPFAINLSFGAEFPEHRLTLRALYNVFGPRLLEVGIQGVPDVVEEPLHSCDVTVAWGVLPELELRASVENLFDDDLLITQGGQVLQQASSGVTVTLGLGWRPAR